MTAFAIDLRRDRITIASDSLSYLPDRTEVQPLGFASKVLVLPHVKAALFSRGQFQITVNAYAQLLLLPQLRSIEDVADALPEILRNITDMYCDQMGIEDRRSLVMLDLTLCGFSAANSRMRLWRFYNGDDYVPSPNGDVPYGMYANPMPPPGLIPSFSPRATVHQHCISMIEAIGRMFAADSDYAGCRIGGEIHATEITPHGVSQHTIATLPGCEEDGHAGAAVYARMGRGEIDPARAVREGLHANPSAPISRQQRRAAERQARGRQRQHA